MNRHACPFVERSAGSLSLRVNSWTTDRWRLTTLLSSLAQAIILLWYVSTAEDRSHQDRMFNLDISHRRLALHMYLCLCRYCRKETESLGVMVGYLHLYVSRCQAKRIPTYVFRDNAFAGPYLYCR